MGDYNKTVKFDWVEVFQTDMEIAFRVTCVIDDGAGKMVEASEIFKIHKGMPAAITPGQQSAVNYIENTAFSNAQKLLNMFV